MAQYRLVSSENPRELLSKVNALLAEGWALVGGISIAQLIEPHEPGGVRKMMYAQALVSKLAKNRRWQR
jgi:hypothetical protein